MSVQVSADQLRAAQARARVSGRSVSDELGLDNATSRAARKWSNAKRATCTAGHRHASILERRACEYLRAQPMPDGGKLFQQVRLPLFALAGDGNGRPLYLSVDFVLAWPGVAQSIVGAWDAKGRESRDWRRGAAAFEATYGFPIKIITAADLKRWGA